MPFYVSMCEQIVCEGAKEEATKSRNKNAINFPKVDTVVSCYQHLWSTTLKCICRTHRWHKKQTSTATAVEVKSRKGEKMHLIFD